MKKIKFKNGTLISKAKVTVNNIVYEVEPAEYEGETPLSASVLNEIQDNIEDAIKEKQTNIDNVENTLNDKITNLTTYSTEEVKTGETWIDGKPIYRKSFTSAVDSSTHRLNIDISDLDIKCGLFDLNNSYINNTKHSRYMPLVTTNILATETGSAQGDLQACAYFNHGYTSLVVEFGYKITGGVFVTIRYTKTTD